MNTAQLLTYLTDAPEPRPGEAPPRVGDPVELRLLPGGAAIEAWADGGRRLGRVPPADCPELSRMLRRRRHGLIARITAVVPRPRQAGVGRIHIGVPAR